MFLAFKEEKCFYVKIWLSSFSISVFFFFTRIFKDLKISQLAFILIASHKLMWCGPCAWKYVRWRSWLWIKGSQVCPIKIMAHLAKLRTLKQIWVMQTSQGIWHTWSLSFSRPIFMQTNGRAMSRCIYFM